MLFLGTSKIDITPDRPVPLAGFAARSEMGPFDGVSHPLHARVLFFRHEDELGTTTSAVIVSADLIWWGSDRIPELKKRIRERWQVDEIILSSTHTHSGPQTSALFTSLLGKPDTAYIACLEERLMEGISIAAGRLESVAVELGKGHCPIGIQRRQWNGEAFDFGPNATGPVDHDLNVIRFTTDHNRVKAILVHYACHPVTTADNFVSSEFTGVAMERLERLLGEETVAAFLQGTCGDINPSVNGQFYAGGDAEVCKLGAMLADDVHRILKAKMKLLKPAALESQTIRLQLPLQRLPERSELESYRSEPGVKGEWSRLLLESPERMHDSIPLELTRLTLAEDLFLLAMNAEVVIEYGLFAKSLSEGCILPMGYCNGMIGYVPTAKQLAEGGYEPVDSTFYFGMPAPFEPAVQAEIRKAIRRLF